MGFDLEGFRRLLSLKAKGQAQSRERLAKEVPPLSKKVSRQLKQKKGNSDRRQGHGDN